MTEFATRRFPDFHMPLAHLNETQSAEESHQGVLLTIDRLPVQGKEGELAAIAAELERERQSRRQAVAAVEALQAKILQQGDGLGKQASCKPVGAVAPCHPFPEASVVSVVSWQIDTLCELPRHP